MSAERRMLEPGSGASQLARDLLGSARADSPPTGARARARARMEQALGQDGMTTTVGALSESAAALLVPNLAPVSVPSGSHGPGHSAGPSGTRAAPPRTWLYAGVGGVLVLVLGAVAAVALLRPAEPPASPVAAAPVSAAPAAPAPSAAPVAAPGASSSASAPYVAAAAEPASASGGSARAAHERGSHVRNSGGSSSGAVASSAAAAPSSGGSPCAQRCHGNIDCLLRCSTSGGGGAQSGGGGGGGSHARPEAPGRNDVISAMRAVAARVSACANGRAGTAQVSITFGSSGHVTSASVGAPYGSTPSGSCMNRAVRSATVPPFTRSSFTVNYPFAVH